MKNIVLECEKKKKQLLIAYVNGKWELYKFWAQQFQIFWDRNYRYLNNFTN